MDSKGSQIAALSFAAGALGVTAGLIASKWIKESNADRAFDMAQADGSDPRLMRRSVSYVEVQNVSVPVRRRDPRTTKDAPVPAPQALACLKEGNRRFADGSSPWIRAPIGKEGREALVDFGQRPSAIILGCADSRVPSDIVFDSQPGDLFILRNAGNTLTKAEGSMVGSMEYAVAHLQAKLILVLGHTKCGAIAGATSVMLDRKAKGEINAPKGKQSALEALLYGMSPVASDTAALLGEGATEQEIAAKAVEVNVFHSMAQVLAFSPLIREKVKSGEVEVHGGIYDLKTGVVDFLGVHPKQHEKLSQADEIKDSKMGA